MNTQCFQSCLTPWFEQFVRLKKACGISFKTQIAILMDFDKYLARRLQDPACLDEALGEYLSSLSRFAPRTRDNKVSVVWQALGYAIRHGAPCPPLSERPSFPRVGVRRRYVYTARDIECLLRTALEIGPAGSLRPHVYATLLALLLTTGLRIGEAHRLDLEDVDLGAGLLHVRRGKFGKSRSLPLRASTIQGLARYVDRRRKAGMPQTPDSGLWVTPRGGRLAYRTIKNRCRMVIRTAGLRTPEGRRPRVHDLRHTYAVNQVASWYRAGIDVNNRLSALSIYLGHVSVMNTLVYLRANEGVLRQAAERFESTCAPASAQEKTR